MLVDKEHTLKLLRGARIAIKIPDGVKVLELQLSPVKEADSTAKLFDVFFNGRKA